MSLLLALIIVIILPSADGTGKFSKSAKAPVIKSVCLELSLVKWLELILLPDTTVTVFPSPPEPPPLDAHQTFVADKPESELV